MKVELVEKENTIKVVAEGDVDLYTSPALRKAILEAAKHTTGEVQVVLSAVGYMDSSGVATLVEGLRAAKNSGKTFTLQSPSNSVMKVLELARLDTIFTILSDGK
ncbi:MAG: STAS domain-containing protein [Candidatus Hydrogenedentes bacterium]|nr:STAS domain-containing protein [Candidatus Hydrogenedentota bacterium]